jgi:hypothetical protein
MRRRRRRGGRAMCSTSRLAAYSIMLRDDFDLAANFSPYLGLRSYVV